MKNNEKVESKFKNLKVRALTGGAFTIITIAMAVIGIDAFIYYLSGLVVICAYEWARLIGFKTVNCILYALSIVGLGVLLFADGGAFIAHIIIFSTPFALLLSWFYRQIYLLAGLFYFSFIVFVLIVFKRIEVYDPMWWKFAILIWGCVVLTDVSAYVFGKFFGKTKLAPNVSPGKTLEGLIGAIIMTALGYAIFNYMMAINGFVYQSVLIGGVIAFVAQMGDLYQSKMKRIAGVKDSGSILPGHGGMFDRIDGLLAVIAVSGYAYIAFVFFGKALSI